MATTTTPSTGRAVLLGAGLALVALAVVMFVLGNWVPGIVLVAIAATMPVFASRTR